MSLHQRLRRLEQAVGHPQRACCPRCPPVAVVYYRQDSLDGAPVLQEGEQLPASCAVCGRPVQVLAVVEDVYFFQRSDAAPG